MKISILLITFLVCKEVASIKIKRKRKEDEAA